MQKGIDENWAAALEHNPEAFARVVWVTTFLFHCSRFYMYAPDFFSLLPSSGYVICGYGSQWCTFEGNNYSFFLYAWLISLPLFLSLPLWWFKVQACTFILKSIIWCFKEKNYNFVLVSVCFCLWELFEKYFGIFLIIK